MADELTSNIDVTMSSKQVVEASKEIVGGLDNVEKKSKHTKDQVKKDAEEMAKANQRLATLSSQSIARAAGKKSLIGERSAANQADTEKRTQGEVRVQVAKRITEEVKIEGRKEVIELDQRLKKENFLFRKSYSDRLGIIRQGEQAGRKLAEMEAKKNDPWRQLNAGAKASGLRPSQELFGNVNSVLGMYNARQQYIMAGATQWRTGVSPSQLLQQNINAAIARGNAANASFFAAQNQGAGGGGRGRGGGLFGSGPLGIFGRLLGGGGGGIAGRIAGSVLSGVGIGVGGYALANVTRSIVEGEKLATSYARQTVAARSLAGGQQQLNELLATYVKASGGAVSKTDALATTTRLLATGMAKTVPEFQKFVRGTRGASIALGRGEPEVQEQTQLAIANTSKRRLDQIGLGVKEVDERIEQLRKNNKGWNREMAFSQAIIDLLDEKYGKLSDTLEGQKTGVEKLAASWDDLKLAMGQQVKQPTDFFSSLIQGPVDFFATGPEREKRNAAAQMRYWKQTGVWDILNIGGNAGRAYNRAYGMQTLPPLLPSAANGNLGAPIQRDRYNEDQMAVIRNANQRTVQLERQFADQRINATQQYEEQRLNIIRNYEKSMAREEQDFVRQRARGLRDYEKQIVDILRDGQERDRELREDYDKQIANINEDSEKRRAKIEENYQEQREKAEREHKDRLLKAAGQLDAIAVLEERKRWRDENKERKKQHDEALDDEKEAADERRQDALEALNERLDDARKADEKRLADMAAARKQQLADEDEDRAIQKQRAKEDHDDELAELKRQHDLQMAEIERQYETQKTALEDALAADLAAVNVYIAGYTERMEKKDKVLEKWLDDYIDKLEKKFKGDKQLGTYTYDPATGPQLPYQGYASGGPVRQTGRAMVHAGEYVLSRQMLAAGWSPTNAYSNSRNVEIHQGAITIMVQPGYEEMVGQLVEEHIVKHLESV